MVIKFIIDEDHGSIKWFNSEYFYKSNYGLDMIPELTKKYKLTVMDLLLLKRLDNYRSCDSLYMELNRKYTKADFRLIYKRLRFMKMKKIISKIVF